MAESPDYGEIGSPPSPPNSDSAKPPPPPPPAPEESNDQSPADPPPSSSSSSPPPSSSSSSTPPPQTNNDSNRNNSAASNATRQPPPAISPPAPKQTPQHGRPALASIAPPPKPYSKSGRAQNNDGPETSSFPTWEVKVGIAVAVVSSVIACFAIITIAIICTRKKRSKSDKHIQYYNNSPMSPRGEKWNMNTNQANNNNHLVINLPPRPGGNAGHGGRQQRSPQGQMANLGGDMSPTYSVQNSTPSPLPKSYGSPVGLNQFAFSYEEIALATKGFSRDNLLGQGGFGYVHKGVLPNGKEIAVKCLKSGSRQGEREFQAEVEIISRVHHRHLVSLVGYCIAGDQKMLVYEFVSNNTLEFHLHDNKDPIMDWTTRVKIALGAAKGLAYLHEDCHPRIIHRDIKSANILLDFNFEAKVADFGLAKLSQDNNTHVSTRVMGTFGYLAPEYASSGKLTDKSDVFSFGVVLLELISGRRPLDLKSDMDESLVDWARPLCNSATDGGDFKPLVDPRLENNYNHDEMTRMVACAGSCIRHSAGRRPKMRQIVRALEGDVSLSDLREAVTLRSGSNALLSSMSGSDDFDSDASNHGKFALEKKDYVSSDFGNTSEYGLHPSSSSSDESGYIGRRRERR